MRLVVTLLVALLGVALLAAGVFLFVKRRRGPGAGLAVLGVAALIAVPFTYAALNDAPDELDEDDLAAALTTTTVAVAEPAGTDAPAATTPATSPATPATPPPGSAAPAGGSTWAATDASTVGYRINEVLFGVDAVAVGRTNAVTGSLAFDGTTLTAAEFSIDMATVESDDSRRDNQYRQIMSVDEFPTATFTLTAPIDAGTEPVEGATAELTATGDLTLRGVTQPVTFDLTAQVTNGQIGVLGNIPILFSDYGIANPSRSGITTEDNGLLEFVLVFAPA